MNQTELPLANANALASMIAGNANVTNLYGSEHLNKVRGVEGMDSFQTKPSSEYPLFEENSDIMCIKITDASNNATCRYFAFNEISREEAMRQISPYVLKVELDSLKKDILDSIRTEMGSFKEEILNAQQSIRKQSNISNSNFGNKSNATGSANS